MTHRTRPRATAEPHQRTTTPDRRQPRPARTHQGEPLPAEGEASLWSPQQTAAFLGVPVATLQKWRHQRTGPAAFKVGRHIRYDPTVVRRWLAEECQLDGRLDGQR